MVSELQDAGSRHITMPVESKNPLLIAKNAELLADLIRSDDVSILHARSRAPAWSCLAAARRTGCPFVTTYHGFYAAKTGLKRLYNSVMVRGDAVIANSAFTAEHIAAEYAGQRFFDPRRVTTIPRGADLDVFLPGRVSEDRKQVFLNAFGAGLRVAVPARFTGWKGQTVVVDALARLAVDRPDLVVSVLMVGRMDEKPAFVESLRSRIADAGLETRVKLMPATDDVAALLAASEVVVSASTAPEAFGRVAVEAQAAGRPVIATAHGGSLETVVDGKTGLLIPPGDAEALAKALTTLHDCGAVGRSSMGERGMEHARKSFTTEAMTASTLAVYRQLLAQRQGEKR